MPAGGILALDLATTVGFCAGMPGQKLIYGTVRLPSQKGEGAVFNRFREWLLDQITVHDPRLIVYEAPILTGARTTPQTALRLMGLVSHTVEIAYAREVRIEPANNLTVKKFMTGSGRAEKPDMVAAARDRGFNPNDHNCADAIAIFLWSEARHAPKVQRAAGPLFSNPGT
jgi:Holliday junction resolvasome RuvABC endonuclease subunit